MASKNNEAETSDRNLSFYRRRKELTIESAGEFLNPDTLGLGRIGPISIHVFFLFWTISILQSVARHQNRMDIRWIASKRRQKEKQRKQTPKRDMSISLVFIGLVTT